MWYNYDMAKLFKKNKPMCIIIVLFIISIITNSCSFRNKDSVNHSRNSLIDSPKYIDITIDYVLPEYIYNSKDDLYIDFYSYLYQYIINEHGENGIATLNLCGMTSLEDALRICKEWDDNDATGLPLVGKAFAPYFAYKKLGSNFVEQKDKNYFIGYCIRNNRFIDFLYFLRKFFYHFRIDEGYTYTREDGSVKNPGGSDFFASPYASIIDTTKFFIYNKDTLPSYFYQANNIPMLYDKIPGLLKEDFIRQVNYNYEISEGSEIILPNNFDCYGFKFLAWYTDQNFNSNPLSTIDSEFIKNSGNSIRLYAKFERTGDFAEEIHKDFPELK